MPVDTYVNTDQAAGEECSSTSEGRHLTFEESVLTHPYHSDGFVDGGDPVFYGDTVGIAFKSAAAATDMIAIDTEGIWWLNVLGIVSDGTADGLAQALVPGQRVYIQIVPGTDTYILSGESDPMNFKPFGIVQSAVTASLTVPTLVAVKVHQERNDWLHVLLGAWGDELLLEGDSALREQTWLKAFLGPVDYLEAGETINGMNLRMTTMRDTDVGSLNVAEFKTHHDYAGKLAAMMPLKINIDSGGGGAAMAAGIEILAEGAGTAHDVLCGIRFHQKDTDGTVMAPFRFDTATSFGIAAITTAPADGAGTMYQIPVDVAGTIVGWIAVYDTTGS
jgi:hypothetical protein